MFKIFKKDPLAIWEKAAQHCGDDAPLVRADAAADALWHKAKLAPGEQTDQILGRVIDHPRAASESHLRLLACLTKLTPAEAKERCAKHLSRITDGIDRSALGACDGLWALGMLAQRRPEVFAATLGTILGRLPQALSPEGNVLHMGVLQSVAMGLPDVAARPALKPMLLERMASAIALHHPCLAQLLSHHAWTDPALCGEAQPMDMQGYHTLGLMRDLRKACIEAVQKGHHERLALVELLAQASGSYASDTLLGAVVDVLRGDADGWVDNWYILADLRCANDWSGFAAWALSLYDQRSGGEPISFVMADLISETAANMRPIPEAYIAPLEPEVRRELALSLKRLMGIHNAWKRWAPQSMQQWLPGETRYTKIGIIAEQRGGDVSAACRQTMALLRELLRPGQGPQAGFDACTRGTDLAKGLADGHTTNVVVGNTRYTLATQALCTPSTIHALQDVLGQYLIGHHNSANRIHFALRLFENMADAQHCVQGDKVAGAARLLASFPDGAIDAGLSLMASLRGRSAGPLREAYFKCVEACDEKGAFHLHEWLSLNDGAGAILQAFDEAWLAEASPTPKHMWAHRLMRHVEQRAAATWCQAHLDSWQPDHARLAFYANILHFVIPTMDTVSLREKAWNLLAFLMSSEGPARDMSLTNWRGSSIPVKVQPCAEQAFYSMRDYCREAGLQSDTVVNVIVGDARVVVHGELVKDVSRFVATASDEIGRAMMATWQGVPRAEGPRHIIKLLTGILSGNACLDGWVTNLNDMMQAQHISIDGDSMDMVLDLQGKSTDHERCSEYLRVFQLVCAKQYRQSSGMPPQRPLVEFESDARFIAEVFNDATFARYLERERFRSAMSIPELIDYQVDVIGVLERRA